MLVPGCWLLLSAMLFAEPADGSYAGRSLDEWRELISRIDLRDPQSRRFVPGLIELIDDKAAPWITRRQAALTLGRLGPLAADAVPHVVDHLDDVSDDPEASPRRWALSSLALFGREAKSAAPKLAEMLADETNSVITRLGCLEALSQIGSAAPEAIPALRGELERRLADPSAHADEQLAIGAAEGLGMIGPDAASAVPALMRAAQSESEHLRRESIRALGRIGDSARDSQTLLFDALLDDESGLVRDVATTALGQTGPSAWPMVRQLFAADDAEVRERAATVVAGWKADAEQIAPGLEPMLTDDSARVRLAAARSWRALTGRHDHVWPVLVELLVDGDRHVRRGASVELQTIVRTGSANSQEIEQLLQDPHPAVISEGRRLERILRKNPPTSK